MKWWKRAFIASLIWTALIALGVLFMIHRIKKEAVSPAHVEAWEDKLGETAGLLFGGGQVAIWALAWSRRPRQIT